MTLKEALIALAEGKKIKRTHWLDAYIYLDGSFIRRDDHLLFSIGHDCEDDWELYEEPKKMVTVYEWLVEGHMSYPFVASHTICTEEEARIHWPCSKLTPLRSFEVEEI